VTGAFILLTRAMQLMSHNKDYASFLTAARASGKTIAMPNEFVSVDEITQARQDKQHRRLSELHFQWKTAPDRESRLFAALEYVTLFEEIYGLEPGENFNTEPENGNQRR
jgi:hypothetical protein